MTLERIEQYLAEGLLTKSEAIKLLSEMVDKPGSKLLREAEMHNFLFDQGMKVGKSWKN